MKNIKELADELRKTADHIEKTAHFQLGKDVDIDDAIRLIRNLKSKNHDVKLSINITVADPQDDEEIKVEYEITESYASRAKAESFSAVLEAYAASKEGKDSLASVARLVKKAQAQSVDANEKALAATS